MKKKIKDLTLEEMNKICRQYKVCLYCPLKTDKSSVRCNCYRDIMIDVIVAFDLDTEVEVDESNND